mmetsp:Transcript_23442/g.61390  ORF Transcript_23442/g.61390 Transcript_23442/m.61390 type:complete len:431 (-) Transcript_23442:1384-2676(-)
MMWKEQLDEALEDDGKIVSYKWLSRTACVPANSAKQMLYTYHKNEAGKFDGGIKALFLVAGVSHRNGIKQHRFVVVPEDKLNATKKKFETITSEHVYSLQRAVPKDLTSALFQVDMPTTIPLTERNKWGSIQCSKMERRETKIEPMYADAADAAQAAAAPTSLLPKASSKPKGKKIDASSFFGKAKTKAKKTTAKPAAKSSETSSPKKKEAKKRLVRKIDSDDDDEDDGLAADAEPAEAADEVTVPPTASPKAPAAAAAATNPSPPKPAKGSPKKPSPKAAATAQTTVKAEATPSAKGTKRKSADAVDGPTPTKRSIAKADAKAEQSPSKRQKAEADEAVAGPSIADALGAAKRTRKITRKEQRTFINEKGYMVTEMVEVEEEVEIDDEPAPSPKSAAVSKKPPTGGKDGPKKKKKQGSLMSFFKPKPSK